MKKYGIEKKQLLIIILGAILIFSIFLSDMFYRKSFSLDKMTFSNGMTSSGSIYGGNSGTVMYGPYISLNKGIYKLNIKYISDSDNYLRITVFNGEETIAETKMPYSQTDVDLKFEIPFDMYDSGVEFVVDYSGVGSLDIQKITLSNGGIYPGAIIMFVLFIIVSFMFLAFSKVKNKEWYLIFYILMSILLGELFKENIIFTLVFDLAVCYFVLKKNKLLDSENALIYSAIILFSYGVIIFCTKSSPLYIINDWVDTQSYYTMGKAIFNGKSIYKDIFEQKGPIFYLMYGIGYLINKHNLYGAYFMEGVMTSLTLIFAYKIANMYLSKNMSLLAAFFMPVFIYNNRFMRYGGTCEEFMTAFIVMSLYFFLRIFKEDGDNPKYMYINGLLGGIILFMKFNITLYFVGLGSCVYIMNIAEKKYDLLLKNIIYTIFGAFTVIIPVMLWMTLSGSISAYFETIYFNSKYSPLYFDINGIYKILRNVIGGFNDNWFCTSVIALGIASFVFVRDFSKRIGGIGIVLSFILLSFGSYIGNYLSYYYMIVCGFVILGITAFLYVIEKHGVRIRDGAICVAAVICIIVSIHYNNNLWELKPFIEYVTVQDYFSMIMHEESENPTLLNYGFLDGGFYTAADIVPNVRFFQKQNISDSDYPLNIETHKSAMRNKNVEFVVVRRSPDSGDETLPELVDNYNKIAEKSQKFEGINFRYCLYKVK